jgi:hypothetical protein
LKYHWMYFCNTYLINKFHIDYLFEILFFGLKSIFSILLKLFYNLIFLFSTKLLGNYNLLHSDVLRHFLLIIQQTHTKYCSH